MLFPNLDIRMMKFINYTFSQKKSEIQNNCSNRINTKKIKIVDFIYEKLEISSQKYNF